MKLPNKFLLGALALTLTAAPVSGSVDLTSLFNQVQNQQQQLNNHNVRISNNEQDIKKLQDDTSTQPAPDHAPVPDAPAPIIVTSTDPATTPTDPTPVAPPTRTTNTIVSVTGEADPGAAVAVLGGYALRWCKYTYDDGSVSYEHEVYEVKTGPTKECKAVGDTVPL